MLKTSEERVRLLKKGIKSKTIEELYIRHNKIKIIQSPILFDLFENSSSNSIDSPDIGYRIETNTKFIYKHVALCPVS